MLDGLMAGKKWGPEDESIPHHPFLAGQPLGLGYYSFFALSHGILVWYCADLVHPEKRFSNYAVLCDDLLIADEAVALECGRSLSSGCR